MSHRRSTVETFHDPDPERSNLLPDDSASLLMDDADFHATYHVPASAPLGWVQPMPTWLPVDPAAHPVSIGSTPAPEAPSGPSATHNPHPVTTATVADRYVGTVLSVHPPSFLERGGWQTPMSTTIATPPQLPVSYTPSLLHCSSLSSASISQHPLSGSYSVHRPSSHEPVQCPMSVKVCVVQCPSLVIS
jgi:hypothetical protein